MFFKKTIVNKGTRRYVYGQVVRSIRRKSDGKPAHEVVASLGAMDEQLATNLQAAFRAARRGKPVVLDDDVPLDTFEISDHYSYLNVAVFLEEWRRWGLSEVIRSTVVDVEREVPVEDVVALLVAHRCIEPASKIEATRWYEETALPELLGHRVGAINNTRVHRTLQSLASCENSLQKKLAAVVRAKRGDSRAFFIDVTDTWFEGKGPELAKTRKTKEGLWKLKIGIVMACTEEGLPLRWKVVGGRAAEQEIMLEAATWLRENGLFEEGAVVVDRAMGHVKSIADMKAAGIRYLTALRKQAVTQFVGDHTLFGLGEDVDLEASDALDQLGAAAQREGMVYLGSGLYGASQGVVTPNPAKMRVPSPHTKRAQKALSLAKAIRHCLDQGEASTLKQAAQQLGVKAAKAVSVTKLLQLCSSIIEAIEAGQNQISVSRLKKLAKLEEAEQLELFRLENSNITNPLDAASEVVIYFHPERCRARRKEIRKHRENLETEIADLNRRLASPRSRRKPGSIENEIRNKYLKPREFNAMFDIELEQVEQDGGTFQQVSITPNDAWSQARSLDGFLVVAAHPELAPVRNTFAQLYNDKNIIEQDFHVLKSPLRLRPVYVHSDPTVRAHVSICMLALLLARSLEIVVNNEYTVTKIMKTIQKVYLNRIKLGQLKDGATYRLTSLNSRQQAILRKLGMEKLIATESLPEVLLPR